MTEQQIQQLVIAAEAMADAIHYVQKRQENVLFLTKGGDMLAESLDRYQAWRTATEGSPKSNWTPVCYS